MHSSFWEIPCYLLGGGKIINACSFQGQSSVRPFLALVSPTSEKKYQDKAERGLNDTDYSWSISVLMYVVYENKLSHKECDRFPVRKVTSFS